MVYNCAETNIFLSSHISLNPMDFNSSRTWLYHVVWPSILIGRYNSSYTILDWFWVATVVNFNKYSVNFSCLAIKGCRPDSHKIARLDVWTRTPSTRLRAAYIARSALPCLYTPHINEIESVCVCVCVCVGGGGGCLPCPSVSVCPSVDRTVSALYLQNYLLDLFHICNFRRCVACNFGKFLKFVTLTLSSFDLGSNMTQ